MASNASSDALGFPVRGMPKTVQEKNIIFNVIKYFEDEKERHGKQKFRPNAVMQKAAEATAQALHGLAPKCKLINMHELIKSTNDYVTLLPCENGANVNNKGLICKNANIMSIF